MNKLEEANKQFEKAIERANEIATETRKNNIRILLAEDNIVNREIALKILGKFGYRIDAVENGMEALKALEKIPYDLVLMDIQMPVMDGYTATREIRNPQSAIRNHKIPVIAMTAHTMQSDRDACIEAGMDDYVSKPISPKKLSEAIERWTENDEESDFLSHDEIGENDSPEDNAAPGMTEEKPPIDLDSALERAMGNKEFLDKMIHGFTKSMPDQIESLRDLIKQGDDDALRKGAHSLKGASATLSMNGLSAAALRLEQMGRTGELAEADQALGELVRQFEVLEEFLALK
jgi:CheY-like chemotaxis protein/HPt (histidine-containing phosphotransfer) domain-containing protein